MNGLKTVTIVAIAALMSACASSKGGGAYERAQARQEMTVRLGVVESVRPVTIEGTKTPIGAGAGAAIGGIAGSTVGHGRGSTAAAILGAVGGGLAGAAIEEHVTKKEGVEITVRLDNGKLIAVTQEADEVFRPGERVRVLSGGGATRVSH
ncbi:MAG: glycine zipper domain-containing protein [Pseudomonadota bacterium]|jgi:outer membrane lipoprotein SlyB